MPPRNGPPPAYVAAPSPVQIAVVDQPAGASESTFDPAAVPVEGEIHRNTDGAATVVDVVLVADGVPLRQRDPDELRWDGTPRDAWEAFCEEWGLDRLRSRPHRWADEG